MATRPAWRSQRSSSSHVAAAAVRQRVAAVGEGVEDDVGDALLRGELDRRLDVLPAGVHAAVGDEAEQVQAPARAVAGPLAGGEQRLVLEEAAVGDRVVDPGQVLLDDRAGAEVEVADLGVAHLAVGQADVAALGGELRVGKPSQSRSKTGVSASEIALPGPGSASPQPSRMTSASEGTVTTTPSGALYAGMWAVKGAPEAHAALTIAAKSAGSRLAPPTRAPSMSGWPSSSAALPGLTEPP